MCLTEHCLYLYHVDGTWVQICRADTHAMASIALEIHIPVEFFLVFSLLYKIIEPRKFFETTQHSLCHLTLHFVVKFLCRYHQKFSSNVQKTKIYDHIPYPGETISVYAECPCPRDLVITV